jgi:hypothetical protein
MVQADNDFGSSWDFANGLANPAINMGSPYLLLVGARRSPPSRPRRGQVGLQRRRPRDRSMLAMADGACRRSGC